MTETPFFYVLKGQGYTFREGNSVKIVLTSLWSGGLLEKEKKFIPMGANAFLLE